MMTRGKASWRACLLAAVLMAPGMSPAAEFSASFKGTDIEEFINTVGKNLGKTIIIEPSVRGKINVRSYDLLNDEQHKPDCKVVIAQQLINRLCGERLPHE